jgi:hypothetical protein
VCGHFLAVALVIGLYPVSTQVQGSSQLLTAGFLGCECLLCAVADELAFMLGQAGKDTFGERIQLGHVGGRQRARPDVGCKPRPGLCGQAWPRAGWNFEVVQLGRTV